MKQKIYDIRQSSNITTSTCAVCKKEYFKRKHSSTSPKCGIVRKHNSKTCTPACAKEYSLRPHKYVDRSEYLKAYKEKNKAKIKEYHRIRWLMKKESLK